MSLRPGPAPVKGDKSTYYRSEDYESAKADHDAIMAAFEANPARFNSGQPLSYTVDGVLYTAPKSWTLKQVEDAMAKHQLEKFQAEPFVAGRQM